MKAIYELRSRVHMHKPQEILDTIVAENILDAVKIVNEKYNIKFEHTRYGFHSTVGTYSLIYKGVVKE